MIVIPRLSEIRKHYDGRYTPPLFITGILLGAHLSYGILESYHHTLVAIGVSILTEIVFSLVFRGKFPHLASAYISGISVGILVRTPLFWPFALCAFLSIASKYVLRVGGRHIWNPSNFGICAMLFLAPYAVAHLSIQWGNDLAAMAVIWILGSIIISRLHRFHICLTYVIGFFVFAFIRTQITGIPFVAEVAPITGPMYQLFVFFMITDPKTTVASKRGQVAVALAVAAVEALLRVGAVVHAPFYALFLVGPPALLIEYWWNSHAASKRVAVQTA